MGNLVYDLPIGINTPFYLAEFTEAVDLVPSGSVPPLFNGSQNLLGACLVILEIDFNIPHIIALAKDLRIEPEFAYGIPIKINIFLGAHFQLIESHQGNIIRLIDEQSIPLAAAQFIHIILAYKLNLAPGLKCVDVIRFAPSGILPVSMRLHDALKEIGRGFLQM